MLLLTSTSDLLRVLTSTATTVDVHASWVDLASGVATPGRTNTLITTATTTTVVASPAASTQRNVKFLSIRNRSTTTANDVTVLHSDGTNIPEIIQASLQAQEELICRDGVWFTYDMYGSVKNTSVLSPVTVVKLAGDQSNATVTPTEVTGLSTPCGIGTWIAEYYLRVQSAATTTGHRFSVNHDGTVTAFMAFVNWCAAINTTSSDAVTQSMVAALGGVSSLFAARTKSTAGWGTTLSVDTLNADVLYRITSLMTVSVAGNIELWHGSEVAFASTVMAGSMLVLTKAA